MSAVDNALWDLRGKAARQPVYRLLGGPTRDRVPVYASMLGHSVEPERAAAAAAEHADLRFEAQKWFFAHGPAAGPEGLGRNLAMATAVREAVGPGYPLMFDAFMGWDATYAEDMLRGLEPVEPHWVEEPVPPERLDCVPASRANDLDPTRHRRARRHALAGQGAARRRGPRDPGRPGLGGWDHRAATHLLALLGVRRPGRGARTRDPGAAPSRGVAVAASRADDRVPGPDPGAEPVLPPDDLPSGGRSARTADGAGLGIDLDPAKIEDRRELDFIT